MDAQNSAPCPPQTSENVDTDCRITSQAETKEEEMSPDMNSQRYRPTSKVIFTIGDSSDCDSVSTTASSYLTTTQQDNNDVQDNSNSATNCCNDNPWHKYHFHEGSLDHGSKESGNGIRLVEGNEDGLMDVGDSEESDDAEVSPEERRKRGLSLSTRPVIPNSTSLARLSDIHGNMDDASVNGANGCFCSSAWGKWRILTACAIVQLFSALMVSLQAPFYPAEAEKKGARATEYGFVFGVFELTVFIIAPFFGSRIHNWNPKVVFNLGIFTAAISSITFGFLDKIDSRNYFIAASALIRVIEALGESALITASFVIVASAFSDSVASTFALLETFYSIGLVSGPIVGSFLYQIGGYSLPFIAVGGGLLVTAVLNFIILPSSGEISEYRSTESVVLSSYSSFRLLGSIPVLVSAICIVIGAMSISYLQATLEPHLRQFHLTQLSVGAILIINGAVYTLTAPLWGILCDKVLQLKVVTFCGTAILICGYSIVGPIPVFSFDPAVWIIATGLALQGIGVAAVLVASFVSILRNVIINGLPDSPSTYGLVSSLWTLMFSLGSFIGPSLSGILYDSVGFSNGTLSIIALSSIMMCILVLFVCTTNRDLESFNYSENEPHNTSVTASGSEYSNHQPSVDSSTTLITQQRNNISYGSI